MRHAILRSKLWRGRLTYVAMSMLVAWHTLAMIFAPVQHTRAGVRALRSVLHPYLTLFALDNYWTFFAPNIDGGYQFRYRLEEADGTHFMFIPINDVSMYSPYFWWIRQMQDAIVYDPDTADVAGRLLCRKHASLDPIAVTLMEIEKKDFNPEDYLRGSHPLDPEFVKEKIVKRVPCPAP
jgi:hypothetical protein